MCPVFNGFPPLTVRENDKPVAAMHVGYTVYILRSRRPIHTRIISLRKSGTVHIYINGPNVLYVRKLRAEEKYLYCLGAKLQIAE